ncbi:helix-turn-helix domain-containing protein [Streptomyces sp. NPDC001984]
MIVERAITYWYQLRMDLLAHLETYIAAVDEASFSRAADRLGIAQPLLS